MTKLTVEIVGKILNENNGNLAITCEILQSKYQTLYAFVKRHHIPFKSKKHLVCSKDQIEEAYKDLNSLSLVAKKFGATKEGIRQAMMRYGLTINELKIHTVNDYFFSEDNEQSFYWAGFIAADGCVGERSNQIIFLSLALAKKDKDHIKLFKEHINTTAPIGDYLVKNSKRNIFYNDTWKSEIKITSKQICQDLTRFNIVPRKSLTYTFPKWMMTHSLKNHFIRGYNDGDGSFFIPKLAEGRKYKQIYFSMRGTSNFLKEIRSSFEQECQIEERKKEIRISSGHGCLEYGGNGVVKKITDYLYKDATIYLPRKYEIAMQAKSNKYK